jgi:hypothetical protein
MYEFLSPRIEPPKLTLGGQNKEYLDNAVAYTLSVILSAELIKIFPEFLRP